MTTPTQKTSALFTHVEALQAGHPWGRFLDAGTGVNSSLWSTDLTTELWCGVTGAPGHAAQVSAAVGERLRPADRLIVSNWTDPALLAGETFDTVLADYLLGAVEGFSPYFQGDLFARLRPLVGRTLYVIGLDPYVVGAAEDEAARMVRVIGRMRDAVLLLADETPYREYPAEWVEASLVRSGFVVTASRRFANRYRAKWVNGQLDMAVRRLDRIPDRDAARGLARAIEHLRAEGLALCEAQGGLRCGHDYVIACRPST